MEERDHEEGFVLQSHCSTTNQPPGGRYRFDRLWKLILSWKCVGLLLEIPRQNVFDGRQTMNWAELSREMVRKQGRRATHWHSHSYRRNQVFIHIPHDRGYTIK